MLRNEPTFRTLSRIGRNLVDAFSALHASGQCYRDINFGNLFVDPVRCDVAILDNDNVGLDGGDVFVKGTNGFMAPEIVRGEALPSTTTDLYSLALFLFTMFVRGHPLEGIRVTSSYSWDQERHRSEHELLLNHYGTNPLFVFDPVDHSNRPSPGDSMLTFWDIYPDFFRSLLAKSFTGGLSDASVHGRVTGSVWRRNLVRLADCCNICTCSANVFWDPDRPAHTCWKCGKVIPKPALLEVQGNSIVLCDGATVSSHHLTRDRAYDLNVAIVESHPDKPGNLTLRNLSNSTWVVVPLGEEPKPVVPTQRLWVRPMTIDFGGTQGHILLDK